MQTKLYRFRKHGALGNASFYVLATSYEKALELAPVEKWEFLYSSPAVYETSGPFAISGESPTDIYNQLMAQ